MPITTDIHVTPLNLLDETNQELLLLNGAMTRMVEITHRLNSRWWRDIHTNQPIQRNVGELLMLVVSELAEGMEGHRKNLHDDHLPGRMMLEVELADALIRIMDLAGGLGLDLAGAWRDKMLYNMTRQDHTHAARAVEGGKKY